MGSSMYLRLPFTLRSRRIGAEAVYVEVQISEFRVIVAESAGLRGTPSCLL